jgi:site-specific recombinase XerD
MKLLDWLRRGATADTEAHIFLNSRGRPWTGSSLSQTLDRLRQRGFDGGCFYKLRHRFCSELAKRGINQKVIAALAGHQRTSTTEIYTSTVGEDLELLHRELGKIDL